MTVSTNAVISGLITADQGTTLAYLTSGVSDPVIDVTRNSANDATDATEVTLATFVIPGGALRLGSVIEVYGIMENTSSASTKTLTLRVDGTTLASFSTTTNQSVGARFPIHVHDANSLVILNNGSVGTGSASGLTVTKTVTGILTAGCTVTLTGKWGAVALTEFIRLKHAKVKVIL